ncbi:unnamed protein product [Prunus armeniaca]
MRYEEMNLYRILVWEVKNMARLVGHTHCQGLPLPAGVVRWPRPYPARAKGLAVDLLLFTTGLTAVKGKMEEIAP